MTASTTYGLTKCPAFALEPERLEESCQMQLSGVRS